MRWSCAILLEYARRQGLNVVDKQVGLQAFIWSTSFA